MKKFPEKNRYLSSFIEEDLSYKMVFLGGARQVGKTTLAENIGKNFPKYDSLNWDNRSDQKRILAQEFSGGSELLVFDEIHKYPDWKNYIKGLFDTQKEKYKILVTGSARLDVYRKGGDSLLGRYHYYRLHPFSVAEYFDVSFLGEKIKKNPEKYLEFSFPEDSEILLDAQKSLGILLERGGFPEPLFSQNPRELKRWRNERIERVVKEDIRDIENIQKISLLNITTQILPERVVSVFSINSLREDVGVSFQTMAHWIDILENFYYLFRIYPFVSSKIKSLKKEPKMFLCDWSEVENEAMRFENCIGSHLLKWTNFLYDVYGEKIELHYLRDKEGREVDFFISKNGKPWKAIEVKFSDTTISKHLKYFQKKLEISECYQIVFQEGVDFEKDGVRVMSASKFLMALV